MIITYKKHRVEYLLFIFSSVILAFYLSPLFTVSTDLFVPPFDFFDISFPMSKILSQSGMEFSSNTAIVPNMMGGLPRSIYGSEFYYFPWLFTLFKPYSVYAVNEILMHVSAFLSMLILLKYTLKNETARYILPVTYSTALLFSLLPFFPGMGLSIPLLPLTWYLFLTIKNHTASPVQWIGLIVLPFFTNFVLIYFFVLTLMIFWFLYNSFRHSYINKPWIISIFILISIYLLLDYRLFIAMFIEQNFISHRVEFVRQFIPLNEAYQGALNLFSFGQSHTLSTQKEYMIPSIVLALILSFFRKKLEKTYSLLLVLFYILFLSLGYFDIIIDSIYLIPILILLASIGYIKYKDEKYFYQSLLFILITSIWYGLWYYEGVEIFVHHISILKIFDFSRFALLSPAIWYILLGLSFIVYFKRLHYSEILIATIFLLQISTLWQERSFYPNPTGLNFQSYYDTKLFQEVAETIDLPKNTYRVGSVGIPPAIALYNGFYTIDGYAPNYPLSYKHKFRDIIKENFKNNKNSRRFFDDWGSQCYIIAGDKNYKTYLPNQTVHYFKFNIKAFHSLGGRYLFSGYKINHADKLGLNLVKRFHMEKSFWTIWLYTTKI